jgi:hypothetical protein
MASLGELFSLDDVARYKQFTQESDLPEEIDSFAPGANALWIGPRTAERIFVYVHGTISGSKVALIGSLTRATGGGLVKPLTLAHLQSVYQIFTIFQDAEVDIAVVVVGFSKAATVSNLTGC